MVVVFEFQEKLGDGDDEADAVGENYRHGSKKKTVKKPKAAVNDINNHHAH